MKRSTPLRIIMVGIVMVLFTAGANARQEPKKMKMTTEIPEGIATPDRLETRIGTLTSFDGVPDKATTQLVYDNLDFQRATQAYLSTLQIASMYAMREGLLGFGPANTTVLQFEELMDSKALWLTPNTVSVYMGCWLELGDEPMVIETPPNVLGFINEEGRPVASSRSGARAAADGSVMLHFAPKLPEGVNKENWIQTNPGEGFFVYRRFYGPTKAYFDESYPLEDIKKVQ